MRHAHRWIASVNRAEPFAFTLCTKIVKVLRCSRPFTCGLVLAACFSPTPCAASAGQHGTVRETLAPHTLAVTLNHAKQSLRLLGIEKQSKGSLGTSNHARSADREGHFLRELYFYPAVSRQSLLHEFDPDWIVKDATVRFPRVEEMNGISIIVHWSQLCPLEKQCNFAMMRFAYCHRL